MTEEETIDYNTGLDSGFDTETFGPPYNLGVSNEFFYTLKAYSEIWGRDPQTGEPREYDVPVKFCIQGKWAFLYFGGCIQPAAPLRQIDSSTIPPDGKEGEYWDWNGISKEAVIRQHWDYDTEVTGIPDRIHFKNTLPSELLSEGSKAIEYAVPCEVIDIDNGQEASSSLDIPYERRTSTKQVMGKLVIADTGLMEIRADYTFRAYQVHKFVDGQLAYSRLGIYNTECFDCGKADPAYTKINKVAGDRTTGFWIGFKPFTLILNLGGYTYSGMKAGAK